jgi:hypothetical protein
VGADRPAAPRRDNDDHVLQHANVIAAVQGLAGHREGTRCVAVPMLGMEPASE